MSLLLLPMPRELELTGNWYQYPVGSGEDSADFLLQTLPIERKLSSSVAHAQGYELTITPEKIQVVAQTSLGWFYADQTLRQLLLQYDHKFPTLICRDWPDFDNRGVMIDVSRDKVPTMEALFELINLLASWKINQIQLYTEHTFAYQNHRAVWEKASPLTAKQIRTLDAYCRDRFIELVPNQNSFGHMRRWLVHDEYRALAECPEGCDTETEEWGYFEEPFTLCPTDEGSMGLLRELYNELLPNFTSNYFNVGCDETIDLGKGRSRKLVDEVGTGRVYLDFLLQMHKEVTSRSRKMMFWGDVISNYPHLVSELPKDMVALDWGYEADYPFEKNGKVLADAGIPFYVCAGTSTWNSIVGRTVNTEINLRNSAENGLKYNADGYLITDWGDNGHWQQPSVSHLWFGYGAGLAWANESNAEVDYPAAVSLFAFQDANKVIGKLYHELGEIYTTMKMPIHNQAVLFRVLQETPDQITERLKPEENIVQRLYATLGHIDTVMLQFPQMDLQSQDAEWVQREVLWGANMLRHGCYRMLWVLGEVSAESLQYDAAQLLAEYETLWHVRNRPGGFVDSFVLLQKMAKDYEN